MSRKKDKKKKKKKEQEIGVWGEVIALARKKGEIRQDIDSVHLMALFRTLYLGLSYRGALIDRLSIEELRRLWGFVYQEYKL